MALCIDGTRRLSPRQLEWQATLDDNWRPPLIVTNMRTQLLEFLAVWAEKQVQNQSTCVHIHTESSLVHPDLLRATDPIRAPSGSSVQVRFPRPDWGVMCNLHPRWLGGGGAFASFRCIHFVSVQRIELGGRWYALQRRQDHTLSATYTVQVTKQQTHCNAADHEAEAARELQQHMIPDLANLVLDYLDAPHCPRPVAGVKRKAAI